MRRYALAAAAIVLLGIASCGPAPQKTSPPPDQPPQDVPPPRIELPSYKTPEEVFKAYHEFDSKGDFRSAARTFSKDAVERTVYRMMFFLKAAFEEMDPQELKETVSDMKVIAAKHKITKEEYEKAMEEVSAMSKKTLAELGLTQEQAELKRQGIALKVISDPYEYFADMTKFLSKDDPPQQVDVQLIDVKIEGDMATGNEIQSAKPDNKRLRKFRKVNGGWLIDE